MKLVWTAWFRPAVLLISALLASGVGILLLSTIKERDLYLFEIDVTNEQRQARIQLFYDIGRGFNEEDSSIQPLFAKKGPIRYGFVIPRGEVRALRLDPTDERSTVVLAKPAIIDIKRREIKRFAIDDLTPLQQVETVRTNHDSLSVKCTGTDPSLLVQMKGPLTLGLSLSEFAIRTILPIWLMIFGACWFVAGLIQTIPWRIVVGLRDRAQRNPLVTIFCTSLFAVTLQCYPVIFFGRSFVSVDNGTYFLYDHVPTLPGYTPAEQEDAQGSDVAALLHTAISYPSLQRQALFRDHELPLWNRYSLGGLPLLGQGQSMFGSVLNFITIIGDSSSGSWDLRFALSRWLYGLGLGITTWLLTRHLGASTLVSFVSLYIAFFGFRLNHMAQLSVDLSPWILVGWAMLRGQASARAAVVLFFANWEVMNSGTIKEAYMLMLCLNLAGLLVVWISDLRTREKLIRVIIAALSGLCLILISAPIWIVFLSSLATGATHYDHALVLQAPPWQILGLFEEMFYRRFHSTEAHVLPAVNFVILTGVAWTLAGARIAWREKACVAVSLALLFPIFLVFGVIPGAFLMELPFINSIHHVHNTFSCPLLVLTSILAGFGFKAMWITAHESTWWKRTAEFASIIFGLFLLYFGSAGDPQGSPFFKSLIGSLCFAVVVGHLGLRSWVRTRHLGALLLGVGGAIFFACWQSGQYIKSPADRYVVNPGKRINLRAHSDAVEHVDQLIAQQPSRPVGLGYNVFAGYSEMLRWESIYGVEPVRNADFDILCDTADMKKKDWGDPATWHEDDLPVILPIQNLLNVRYYLAPHTDNAAKIKGLRWIASHDLDLYESPDTWPRAFYTDRYTSYNTPVDLIYLIKRNAGGRPFASLQGTVDLPDVPRATPEDLSKNIVAPAHDYRLTSNKTKFIVEAPKAGLAVLTENYLAGDFRAFINGKQVPYYKINQTAKGVIIPGPGTYEILFEYWPRRLTLALILTTIGVGLATLLLGCRLYIKRIALRPPAKLLADKTRSLKTA